MGGFRVAFGVGLSYPMPNRKVNGFTPPTYLSCFGTGIWEMEGIWLMQDTWKMQATNTPFLPMGVWNNEGTFRFKDKFSFGMSFLPTGFFRYDGIYRFTDKIKIQEAEKTKAKRTTKKVERNYWNF